MAERNPQGDRALTADERFHLICLATYCMEPLIDALSAAAQDDSNPDGLRFLVLGLVPRMHQLNFAAMGAGTECMASEFTNAGLPA